ncbi:MAG: methyltransferase domain-containing protein, partial [Ilumatobacteraceae bacterium]
MDDRETGGHASSGELYHDDLIGMLELVWGDGFLSPGGLDEVARVLAGVDLAGKSVLDIGCGVGGVDVALVERFGAGWVTGIDVEETVLVAARRRIDRHGLSSRIGVAKVAPGPLPLPPASFDVVFSKDSIVHVPDKHALAREVARVLAPGGWFAASDWLIGHDDEPSPAMQEYLAAEGLDFGMASPGTYRE